MMSSEQRQSYILKIAKEKSFVSIAEVSAKLDISIETVRRDINKLCEYGLVKKVRGGAAPVKFPSRKDADYLLRIRSNQQAKLTIAVEAADMIRDGQVVAFDCGVSIQSIAYCVSDVKNVTLVTNSIPVATILLDKLNSGEISGRIIVIGGECDTKNRFSKGGEAINEIMKYHFDIAFVSCTALSQEAVSSYSLDECSYSKQLVDRSNCSVLVAESDKIGKNSVCTFAKITDFDKIITDDLKELSDEFKKKCEEAKVELVIATRKSV